MKHTTERYQEKLGSKIKTFLIEHKKSVLPSASIFIIIICLLVGLSLPEKRIAEIYQATLPPSVSISPATLSVLPDQQIDLNVDIANALNLFGFQMDISYDQSVLEFVKWSPADFISNGHQAGSPFWVNPKLLPGLLDDVAVTRLNPNSPVSGSGRLISLTFKTIAEGNAEVKVKDLILAGIDANPITATVSSSLVRVILPSPSPVASPSSLPVVLPSPSLISTPSSDLILSVSPKPSLRPSPKTSPMTLSTPEPTANPEQEETSEGGGIFGWVGNVVRSILARLFPRN